MLALPLSTPTPVVGGPTAPGDPAPGAARRRPPLAPAGHQRAAAVARGRLGGQPPESNPTGRRRAGAFFSIGRARAASSASAGTRLARGVSRPARPRWYLSTRITVGQPTRRRARGSRLSWLLYGSAVTLRRVRNKVAPISRGRPVPGHGSLRARKLGAMPDIPPRPRRRVGVGVAPIGPRAKSGSLAASSALIQRRVKSSRKRKTSAARPKGDEAEQRARAGAASGGGGGGRP